MIKICRCPYNKARSLMYCQIFFDVLFFLFTFKSTNGDCNLFMFNTRHLKFLNVIIYNRFVHIPRSFCDIILPQKKAWWQIDVYYVTPFLMRRSARSFCVVFQDKGRLDYITKLSFLTCISNIVLDKTFKKQNCLSSQY